MKGSSSTTQQRGATMVEAAIVFPVLLFLVFGAIQWGMIVSAYINLRSASATAARAAVLHDLGSTSNEVQQKVADIAASAIQPQLNPSRLTVAIDDTVQVAGDPGVKVELSYNFPVTLRFVVPGASGGNFRISAATTMR